jgi:glycerol-1-phosphate dehydrogenase [NAD(P)+]
MTKIDPIYVGTDAIGKLLDYVAAKGLKRFAIVADTNTYKALGQRTEAALKDKGYEVSTIVLQDEEIHADEHHLIKTLIQAPLGDVTFVAVGSGSITDITRFVSHRSGRAFISLPTAPSVDGFASIGAPIILAGVKTTILCQAPVAIFADIDTLANAPQRLIAAGFGDMIGKYTSLADWKMGSLVWNEPYDATIAKRMQAAIDSVVQVTEGIGKHTPEGIKALTDALIESGLCMLDFGETRPASGAEHHASHYWEMKRLREHGAYMLHGAQVGYALTLITGQYAKIRALSRSDVMNRLEGAALPSRNQEIELIQNGYDGIAPDIIKSHAPFLELTEADFDALKHRIADHWSDIEAIAATVPEAETIRGYLRQVGGPATSEELGLTHEEVNLGLVYGHFLRSRFTVIKLSRILDVPLI